MIIKSIFLESLNLLPIHAAFLTVVSPLCSVVSFRFLQILYAFWQKSTSAGDSLFKLIMGSIIACKKKSELGIGLYKSISTFNTCTITLKTEEEWLLYVSLSFADGRGKM